MIVPWLLCFCSGIDFGNTGQAKPPQKERTEGLISQLVQATGGEVGVSLVAAVVSGLWLR